jgi:hypothetical protein
MFLNKHTSLDNPFETENYVLSLNNANKYKSTLPLAYQHYCLANKVAWSKALITPQDEFDEAVQKAKVALFLLECTFTF